MREQSTGDIVENIVEACRRLYGRNLLAAGDGNISYRLNDGRIAITPTGVAKAFMKSGDMAFMTLEGEILQGRPSAEKLMHLAVYRACPGARSVVHAHPPTAIAWTIARPDLTELPSEALPEVILTAGRIPVVPYARPGSPDLGFQIEPFLPDHRLLILARHGALCWGDSLDEAINGLERLEHAALILKLAHELGGLHPLPPEELEALRQMRTHIGPRIL